MATKRKTTRAGSKKNSTRRKPAAKPALDRRFSILLFGFGVLFVLLSFLKGEALWAWLQTNLLFGVFGISGWLVGPLLIYAAVLVGLEKPVGPALLKGLFIMLALSGAALVFSEAAVTDLGFADTMKALFHTGTASRAGGGFLSLVLGWTLLALCGRLAARILLVAIVLIAVMVFTGFTPADAVRFVQGKLAQRPKRQPRAVYEEEYDEYEEEEEPEPVFYDKPAPKKAGKRRKKDVDVDLGPSGPQREEGIAEHDEVEIGPGGTFGMNPLEEPPPREEPLLPFDPYSQQSLTEGAQQHSGSILLMSETSAELAKSFHRPMGRGDLFDYDVEAGNDAPAREDMALFDEVPAPPPPVQVPAAPRAEAPEAAALAPDVEALIDNAMPKQEEKTGGMPPMAQPVGTQRYRYPPLDLFDAGPPPNETGAKEEMRKTADLLVNTLTSFGVQTKIMDVLRGPSVTRYEIQPQAGVKISKITNLADDIALNLAAAGVRIEAPIPGKPAVGIEVPNHLRSTVSIRSIFEKDGFKNAASPLSVALGKDIAGDCVVADLTKMPHLLIAGSTGSGKSVCVNATIMSFLRKSSPEDLKLLLIDPKVVELAEYNGIPHLVMPVVTEPRKAAGALGAAVAEMERRYHLFAENNVRDIRTYNKRAERTQDLEKMPYIAIVIDELADLMMAAGKDVETYICRIAQKARAAGMHLIVATQRPSVDVITGLIKANIPSRIAFAVSSQVDSRTILDGAGAEKLLGMGDMLFMPVGANKPVRVQGTYVNDEEISRVLDYIKNNSGEVAYDEEMIQEMEKRAAPEGGDEEGEGADNNVLADETFVAAVETALEQGQISTSFLQRRLRLGYARAGRIMDQMEQHGIVSGPDGSKPRQLLITRQQWQEMSMNAAD